LKFDFVTDHFEFVLALQIMAEAPAPCGISHYDLKMRVFKKRIRLWEGVLKPIQEI
jgi:hypothetical protein